MGDGGGGLVSPDGVVPSRMINVSILWTSALSDLFWQAAHPEGKLRIWFYSTAK